MVAIAVCTGKTLTLEEAVRIDVCHELLCSFRQLLRRCCQVLVTACMQVECGHGRHNSICSTGRKQLGTADTNPQSSSYCEFALLRPPPPRPPKKALGAPYCLYRRHQTPPPPRPRAYMRKGWGSDINWVYVQSHVGDVEVIRVIRLHKQESVCLQHGFTTLHGQCSAV